MPFPTISVSTGVFRFGRSVTLSFQCEGALRQGSDWLFAADEGDTRQVVMSVKLSSTTFGIVSWDPTNSGAFDKGNWTSDPNFSTVSAADYAGGDRWHAYKYNGIAGVGRHWMSYAWGTGNSQKLSLVVCDAAGAVDSEFVVYSPDASDTPLSTTPSSGVVTNDHFVVDLINGVAAAIGQPGQGSYFYHIGNRYTLVNQTSITDSANRHSNGSSAYHAPVGGSGGNYIQRIASQSLSMTTEGSIMHFSVRLQDGEIEDSETTLLHTLSSSGYNLSMGTLVKFDNGCYAITYRRMRVVSSDTGFDFGDICRVVYAWDGTEIVSETVLSTDSAVSGLSNRPHTCLWNSRHGTLLLTCWTYARTSGDPSNTAVWLRIESVTT